MASEASAHLERMLIDASVEATHLPISFLESITDNFADDREIGSGGFAVVYKGILQNGTIAVKKLSDAFDMDENKFIKEVACLRRVKHRNIVRFLGYCADAKGQLLNHQGKMVIADERQRLLCFEFLPRGSLDKYIADASRGLEWKTRYQIIKGICMGLDYLHQQRIVHLDLKPANILLDHYMVPKIADFGISKCFDENQTRSTTLNLCGSRGYVAPESYDGVITLKSDIYSLGIIIIEILTGRKCCPDIENVVESWSVRFEMSQTDRRLAPVRVCTEIGLQCTDFNPTKRPNTRCILERLDEMEQTYVADVCTSSKTGESGAVIRKKRTNKKSSAVRELVDEVQSLSLSEAPSPLKRITSSVPKGLGETSTEILDVHPLELQFPFEPNELIRRCPVTLTNRTDCHVGVWITPTWAAMHFDYDFSLLRTDNTSSQPSSSAFRWMEPHSTVVVDMKIMGNKFLQDTGKFEVVMIVMTSKKYHLENYWQSFIGRKLKMDGNLLKRIEEWGDEVHRAMLKGVIVNPASSCQRFSFEYTFIEPLESRGTIKSIDVHPKKPWLLVTETSIELRNIIYILNYETKEILMVFHPYDYYIYSAKFIAQKEWFATGYSNGQVHVHADATKDVVMKFKAHGDYQIVNLMAVHSTFPFLLTASSHLTEIKLWDWSQNWKCIRTFDQGEQLSSIKLNPLDTDTFASISASRVKVWKIGSSIPITTCEEPRVQACCFTGDSHGNYMVTCPSSHLNGGCVRKWDMRTVDPVHKLVSTPHMNISDVACHPTLPILATIDGSKNVCLWDTRTYRLEKIFQLVDDAALTTEGMVFTGTKDLPRLVVGCERGITILEINSLTQKTDLGNDGWKKRGFAWSTIDTTHT